MTPPWFDRAEQTLVLVMQGLLAASFVAVLVIGTLMIVNMNASERSQGGGVYVGLAMLVLLAVIVGKFTATRARRKPQ
jgi:membrane-bound ClpP family serine protease